MIDDAGQARLAAMPILPLDHLLAQMYTACKNQLYQIALMTALCLPDICCALESENGQTDSNKYKAWVNKFLAPRYFSPYMGQLLDGDSIWAYRNGMIHQGRSAHKNLGYSRIGFLLTKQITGHMNIFGDILNLDLRIFLKDMESSVLQWRSGAINTEAFRRNWPNCMQEREESPLGNIPVLI